MCSPNALEYNYLSLASGQSLAKWKRSLGVWFEFLREVLIADRGYCVASLLNSIVGGVHSWSDFDGFQ